LATAKDVVSKVASAIVAAEEEKTLCAVCSQPTSKGKPLCYDCWQRSEAGEITKCEVCGRWKNNNLPLCRDCWEAKKKTKEGKTKGGLDFRERYADQPKYTCKDGRPVRSKAERDIANYLYDNGIRFRYETKLIVADVEVYPDFYMEDVDLILEHFGMDDPEYNRKRRKKEKLYRDNGRRFVCTEKEDEFNISDVLTTLLSPYFPDKQLK